MMFKKFGKLIKICALFSLAGLLASCADKNKASSSAQTGVQKSTTSNGYRGTPMRNPNVDLSSDIGGSQSVTVSNGSRSSKYLALTFDDGPHPVHTPRLLDMLRERNVKATFYVLGPRVQSYPHIIRRMVAEGHEIGNHTWTHGNLKHMSDQQIRSEFARTRDMIVAVSGVQPRTMRAPYGSIYTRQREMVYREFGYPTVMWDVDPLDWKKPGHSVVAQRLISRARNGSILLLHDIHGSSVDAVPHTIDSLLRAGYQFVTVSQLIAQKSMVSP